MIDKIPSEKDLLFLREEIRRRLSPPRAEHSVSVELECAVIGKIEKLSETDILFLRVSGLLHDLTREMPVEKHVALLREFRVDLPDDGVLSGAVLHQLTAPIVISVEYPAFCDPVVLDPIRTHTTGDAHMSKAQKILFLADMIEPKRKHRACREMRTYYYTHVQEEGNLDRSVCMTLKGTISHLLEIQSPIAAKTVSAYNDILQNSSLFERNEIK